MKSLKEALLNRPKNIDVARMTQTAAEEYINANYNHTGELTFETVDGIYMVNCDGDVGVKNKEIEKLTDGFEWGKVKGSFTCPDCKNLTSLEGAPKEVGRIFNCKECRDLKTLEGAPKYVGGEFNCVSCTNLKTLKGAPKKVDGDFRCEHCKNLKTLEGSPKYVGRCFFCSGCTNLKTLEGSPKRVGGYLDCYFCYGLKSLEGAPEKVRRIRYDMELK